VADPSVIGDSLNLPFGREEEDSSDENMPAHLMKLYLKQVACTPSSIQSPTIRHLHPLSSECQAPYVSSVLEDA
jgi:hypothetical protein